jgi:anti-sigma B factor antagonist
MELYHETLGGVVKVTLKGMIDASSAQTLKKEITALIQDKPVNLVLDLEGVGFVDSTGLGAMISLLRQVHQDGGDIKLASLQERIRAIFELTRLDKVFDICSDSEEAVDRFGSK